MSSSVVQYGENILLGGRAPAPRDHVGRKASTTLTNCAPHAYVLFLGLHNAALAIPRLRRRTTSPTSNAAGFTSSRSPAQHVLISPPLPHKPTTVPVGGAHTISAIHCPQSSRRSWRLPIPLYQPRERAQRLLPWPRAAQKALAAVTRAQLKAPPHHPRPGVPSCFTMSFHRSSFTTSRSRQGVAAARMPYAVRSSIRAIYSADMLRFSAGC